MKTFIVPADFSDTSKNASLFAAQMTANVPDAQIILYHQFDTVLVGSDSSPLTDEPEARKKIAEIALENVKAEMDNVESGVTISYVAVEESSFIKSLEKFIQDTKADMVIMGITGTSGIELTLIGSKALSLVNRNVCPVLIVPPQAHFKGIRNVLFATDYKDIETSLPVGNIKSFLDFFSPVVHVVNVDKEDVQLSVDFINQKKALDGILAGYNPTFHFIRQADFADAINQFVADKNIDLILTIPRKHVFLSNLFKPSHTKQLAYHSYVPIIAIHE